MKPAGALRGGGCRRRRLPRPGCGGGRAWLGGVSPGRGRGRSGLPSDPSCTGSPAVSPRGWRPRPRRASWKNGPVLSTRGLQKLPSLPLLRGAAALCCCLAGRERPSALRRKLGRSWAHASRLEPDCCLGLPQCHRLVPSQTSLPRLSGRRTALTAWPWGFWTLCSKEIPRWSWSGW